MFIFNLFGLYGGWGGNIILLFERLCYIHGRFINLQLYIYVEYLLPFNMNA